MVNGTEILTNSSETHIGIPAAWFMPWRLPQRNSGRKDDETERTSTTTTTISSYSGAPDESPEIHHESEEKGKKSDWSKTATRVGLMSVVAGLFYLLYLQAGLIEGSGGSQDQNVFPMIHDTGNQVNSSILESAHNLDSTHNANTTGHNATYLASQQWLANHQRVSYTQSASTLMQNATCPRVASAPEIGDRVPLTGLGIPK